MVKHQRYPVFSTCCKNFWIPVCTGMTTFAIGSFYLILRALRDLRGKKLYFVKSEKGYTENGKKLKVKRIVQIIS